ncbi:MAG: hypothetical protein AB203_02500 [Parcubacteria bacterium C7867-008]|nr:MAG: hypothetical protein AB203_02500 [Parcubacteria bacterium C7867-008]
MERHDELAAASMEDIRSINWEELNAQSKAAEEHMESINLVPVSRSGEQYLTRRYPIAALYTRFQLQELSATHCTTTLSEDEIQDVSAEFYSEYPFEIDEAIIRAIKAVIAAR